MLACCNAARLWKESNIPIDVLKNRVLCITFGQPLVAISYVQETVDAIAKFENTIHSIYDQEDMFPRLLRDKYPSEGSRLKAITSSNGASPPVLQKLSSEVAGVRESIIIISEAPHNIYREGSHVLICALWGQ